MPAPADLHEFWSALGAAEDKVDYYAQDIRLYWDLVMEKLCVSKQWASGEGVNVMDELSSIILFFLECKTFNEARWGSVRVNSQVMVCGLATGLRSLVELVKKQPGLLKEYIGGF